METIWKVYKRGDNREQKANTAPLLDAKGPYETRQVCCYFAAEKVSAVFLSNQATHNSPTTRVTRNIIKG